ncbi:hypothetical protein ACH5RR_012371 [Cinchona calisaya]|uniref:Uncharacterized protein n=1 Tax=Cinchona calisaya TaxID=153742 RepID=A0ABD3AB67_9GENT
MVQDSVFNFKGQGLESFSLYKPDATSPLPLSRTVRRKHALILYALVKGWDINVGTEICKSIRRNGFQIEMEFIFPSVIIIALCAKEVVISIGKLKSLSRKSSTSRHWRRLFANIKIACIEFKEDIWIGML